MQFKEFVQSIFLTFLLFLSILTPAAFAQESEPIFFYGKGCPHCANVEEFFQKQNIKEKYNIQEKEIYFNDKNRDLFNQLMAEQNIPSNQRGVPALYTGEEFIIGDTPIINYFKSDPDLLTNPVQTPAPSPTSTNQSSKLTLPLVLAASAVDAINPCAFAVLIILTTTLLAAKKRKQILTSGIAFSSAIFISYLLMGLGLYQALSTALTAKFTRAVAILAILIGLFNLKDFFWYGKGFIMEVPKSWRPKMKSFLTSITSPKGAFIIGFLISLFLLPCTSGPYIVILGMLADSTRQAQAFGYLVLYNLVFISPMILIAYLVQKGLDPQRIEKLRQKHLRTLHLIAGIILLAMGAVLLL